MHDAKPKGDVASEAAGQPRAEAADGVHSSQPMDEPTLPELKSTLTCPQCGATHVEVMPTNACMFFYECSACHALLRPKAGDCCVFCSFGSVKCPPVQLSQPCCARSA